MSFALLGSRSTQDNDARLSRMGGQPVAVSREFTPCRH